MAFRLRPGESVKRGLRRLAAKQLGRARDELRRTTPPRDVGIHEARKSLKKARAILELVEADDGSGGGGSRKLLRSVNRTLSHLRDADATLEILRKLKSRNPRLLDEHTFVRIQRHLSSRQRDAMKQATRRHAWRRVDRDLRELRRAAKRWTASHRGFRALAAGLRDAQRRGRDALARARKSGAAADFHEWRKAIKTLWYHLRLIEPSAPAIARDVRALHRAEAWLGDDHNLVVLCEELSTVASLCPDRIVLDQIRLAADRFQCELRTRAVEAAGPIYRRTPRGYVKSAERAWKAWRSSSRRPARRPRAA
jgi:CHAD domain-containing protein